MNRICKALLAGAMALGALTGCAVKSASQPGAPTLIPGASNQFASDTFTTLLSAHDAYDQAKADSLNANYPAQLAAILPDFKLALNVAQLTFSAYIGGTATQTQVTSSLNAVVAVQAKMNTAVQNGVK